MVLGSKKLTLKEFEKVCVFGEKVTLSPQAKKQVQASRAFLEKEISSKKVMYGINTGFGLLSSVHIQDQDLEELQVNLLRSHAVGVGAPLSEVQVRGMLLLRINSLIQGFSGVKLETVELMVKMLNSGVHPHVPSQGSVGASGDLAPLSHMALVLIGEGKAYVDGKLVSGKKALELKKLKPITLSAKEGLALINGTQMMTSLGALACLQARRLVELSDFIGAFSLEAFRGSWSAMDQEIHQARNQSGQIESAKKIRSYLGEKTTQIAKSHVDCKRVQDPYSFRCMPQVHGASRDALSYVENVVERELSAVTDNPLLFSKSKKVISGGNFHGEPVAMALDFLSIAMSEIGSISEQRIHKLINPVFSELPAFLVKNSGTNSGFMMAQVTAAALVSENKTLSHPASVDSIPTSGDKEDHVSMGPWASRKLTQIIDHVSKILAIEVMCSAQAFEFLRPMKSSQKLEWLHSWVRKKSKALEKDRNISEEISEIANLFFQDQDLGKQIH